MRTLLFMLAAALLTALVPAAAWADDQATAQEIADHLRESGRLRNYSIGVKYREGTAWLSGRVASQQQMTDAMHLARQMPMVGRVVNQLEINRGEEPIDAGPIGQSDPAAFPRSQVRQASAEWAAAPPQLMQGQMPVQHAAPQRGLRGRPIPVGYVGAPQPGMVAPASMGPHPGMGAPPEMVAGMPAEMGAGGGPLPAYVPGTGGGVAPAVYDQPHMPNYSWPSYSAYPNYAALTYPRQYSPTAWPFIGPFYPYPQVPLGWRKVTLEWDDGWWFLDFKDSCK